MFSNYKLSEDILTALELLRYNVPTDIQKEVIPAMLDGKRVVAKAPTGSGKTAAFAIPLCERVTWDENMPQAIILEPTRELAVQVRDEVFCIARKKKLKVPAVFGGFPIDKQIQTLRQKSHIVVGTPGRVMDLIRRGSLKLEKISHV
ncbi:DEAD/DEAH box helicase, partial [Anaerosporobacter sp.]|uniref:DEAD/DEAH box helicase n=1 Tax=Anaerosporobacter sp. TaxID=1872529 RepID=UPI00286F2477